MAFLVSVGVLIFVKSAAVESKPAECREQMENSYKLAEKWLGIASEKKAKKGIKNKINGVKYSELLGEEYNSTTTTLGSLEAKEISLNPDFASLACRWMIECGIDSTSTIGICASSSFPALVISTLAAAQTLKTKVVLFTSFGASMFGANDTAATWVDIENWLADSGGLKYKSAVITYGGNDDNGEGMPDEGKKIMDKAAQRNNVMIYKPAALNESINMKMDILKKNRIKLFVNIGGNETALGNCSHSAGIPNGLQKKIPICSHSERGLIIRTAETGVPIINLLNIKALAAKYGISEPAVNSHYKNEGIYLVQKINIAVVAAGITALLLFFVFIYRPAIIRTRNLQGFDCLRR